MENMKERKQRNFGRSSFGRRSSFKPVNVGEELDVTIEAVGEKGDGIAKKDGFVLFVPGVKEGDKVRIKVTKVFRKVGFAEVVGEASKAGSEETVEEQKSEEESNESEEMEDSEEF